MEGLVNSSTVRHKIWFSNNVKTKEDKDFTTVPEGIAHFLEHKLFENEDYDVFSLYAKTGANGNAFTSFDKTYC